MSDRWQDQPRYKKHVEDMKRRLPVVEQRNQIDETPCFAWLWRDDSGECPETACALRPFCQQTWNQAQVAAIPQKEVETISEIFSKPIDSKPRSRVLKAPAPKRRGRYKNSSKYDRTGYKDESRPVDRYSEVFFKALGNPSIVSGPYTVAGDVRHTIAVKQTKSYHAFIHNGVVHARMWMNTPKRATVDLVAELVTPVVNALQKLKSGEDYHKPTKIPEGSWLKVRPCTYRVALLSEEAAEVAGNAIRKALKY